MNFEAEIVMQMARRVFLNDKTSAAPLSTSARNRRRRFRTQGEVTLPAVFPKLFARAVLTLVLVLDYLG